MLPSCSAGSRAKTLASALSLPRSLSLSSFGYPHWLVSIAALPFGTFGEMLGADLKPPSPGCGESCANKWRGMLFGMSNRAGWNGYDPNDNIGEQVFDCLDQHLYKSAIRPSKRQEHGVLLLGHGDVAGAIEPGKIARRDHEFRHLKARPQLRVAILRRVRICSR